MLEFVDGLVLIVIESVCERLALRCVVDPNESKSSKRVRKQVINTYGLVVSLCKEPPKMKYPLHIGVPQPLRNEDLLNGWIEMKY